MWAMPLLVECDSAYISPPYTSADPPPPPLLPRLLVGPFPGMPCELTGMEVE